MSGYGVISGELEGELGSDPFLLRTDMAIFGASSDNNDPTA